MISSNVPHALLDYSISLLERAFDVADHYGELGFATYSEGIGPQLRHVIEHYEALLIALRANTSGTRSPYVDYDARARDQHLERDSHAAQLRLRELQIGLQSLRGNRLSALDRVVTVRSRAGHAGHIEIITQSTIGRELTFLASHTVHHFALLEALANAQGTSFGLNFGRAPATISNDRLHETTQQT